MIRKVGDRIGFKADVEQYARIVKVEVRKSWYIGLKSDVEQEQCVVYTVKAPPEGFQGDYIGRADFHEVDHDDTW